MSPNFACFFSSLLARCSSFSFRSASFSASRSCLLRASRSGLDSFAGAGTGTGAGATVCSSSSSSSSSASSLP